eukprot:s839_g19.t1
MPLLRSPSKSVPLPADFLATLAQDFFWDGVANTDGQSEVSAGPELSARSMSSQNPRGSSPSTSRVESTKSLQSRQRGQTEEGQRNSRVSFDTTSLMSERVDAEISKRYDIDMREIGIGGYGKAGHPVFLAKDRMFKDRQVAIKKVVKIDEEKDTAFKKEVQQTYSNYGKLPESMMAPIIKQVASALKYAHSKGIAHRVIDWGLAGSFEQGRMKSSVGTSTYSAPEAGSVHRCVGVLDPEDDDDGYTCARATDLMASLFVAYVALSGKPPFWGSPKQQVARMRAEKYPLSGEQGTLREPWQFLKVF